MTTHLAPTLLSLGILLGIFTWNAVALGETSKILIPRGRNENSKLEYPTYRPYKADFDLLRVSDKSQELEMPLVLSNRVDDSPFSLDDLFQSEPTLRSRKRRQVQVGNSDFQRFSLCLPYFNTNPMCQQLIYGLGGSGAESAQYLTGPSTPVAVPNTPSAILVAPSSNSISAPVHLANRNDLAVNYYYQPQAPQLLPQQPAVPLQVGIFQGPIPVQRQRQNQQYQNIHTKYPYPYPAPVIPESINTEGEVVSPGPATEISTALPLPSDGQSSVTPAQEDAADAPVPVGYVPESPQDTLPEQVQSSSEPPALPPSSFSPPLPPSSSEAPPPPPPSAQGVPVSPQHIDDPLVKQQANHDIAMQNMHKKIKEKDEEIRHLQIQVDQATQQIVSYEQENAQYKDQYLRSEDANLKLRDRVQQLEDSNQHLQEQNGQLQQVTAEQRTQINALKVSAKDAKEKLDIIHQQNTPLTKEAVQHRKEIEDFLIRIRNLGEENETCKKQLKLYQLKINYIQQQNDDADGNSPDDAELSRMDAEIAALEKNTDKKTVAEETLQLDDSESPTTSGSIIPEISEQSTFQPSVTDLPPAPEKVAGKGEHEFPGEAVQVPQRSKQPQSQQPPQGKTVATAEDVARAEASRGGSAWEKPAGF